MQAVLESGAAKAAILKDDAILTRDFPAILAVIESHAPAFDDIDLHRNFKKLRVFYPAIFCPAMSSPPPERQNTLRGRPASSTLFIRICIATGKTGGIFTACKPQSQEKTSQSRHISTKPSTKTPLATALSIRPQAAHWCLIRRAIRLSDTLQKRLALHKLRSTP